MTKPYYELHITMLAFPKGEAPHGALKEVEKMSRLVSMLEAVERSIRLTVDIAVNKRSSVAFAMGGMEEELEKLKSTLVDLDRETGRCDGFVQFGRTLTRDRIFEFLSCGEKRS